MGGWRPAEAAIHANLICTIPLMKFNIFTYGGMESDDSPNVQDETFAVIAWRRDPSDGVHDNDCRKNAAGSEGEASRLEVPQEGGILRRRGEGQTPAWISAGRR